MNLLGAVLLAWCLAAAARPADACGGTYRGFQYTISSPNYPSNYPTRTECIYRLEAEATPKCQQEFHLQFLDFNVKASEGCKADYLQVGDKHLYCGNTAGLRTFTGTSNNTLILTFHSADSRDTAKGFKILVSALPCSLKLSPLSNAPLRAREIEGTVYRRGVRGGHGVRLNPLLANDVSSSIDGDQMGSVAAEASENNSIINGNGNHPRVTSYLFLPPKETSANVTLHYRLGPSSISGVTSLPTDLLPPRINSVPAVSGEPLDAASSVKKIGGLPALAHSAQDYGCDNSGRLLPQSNDEPAQSASPNLVYDPKYGFVGSNAGSGYYPAYPSAAGYQPSNYPPECCRVPASSPRFSIASPGFPAGLASSGNQLSCRYTIVKSSPDVCRLRLNLRFFNFGADEPYCSLGHVDVDGQRLCGCRTGQSLQLPFADHLVKTISIFGAGYPRSRLSGFLIDVAQERCDAQPPYPGGYIRRRSVTDRRDLGYSYPEPDEGLESTHQRFFAGHCQARLLLDWAIASKEAFFENARCSPAYGPVAGFGASLISRSYVSAHCQDINESQGEIKSPLYPNVYPGNLNKCYRFNRAPNFCKLELYVRDFDLESSQDCASDYLSFSVEPKKYCGRSLNDFRMVFDLTQTSSLEVDFVSDDRGTGRGFDMGFSQLPCEPTSTL